MGSETGTWEPLLFERQSTLLEPRRLLYPGMCGDSYQLSGASGTLLLYDTTSPLFAGLKILPTGYGPQRRLPRRLRNGSPVQAGAARISADTGFGERWRFD